MGKTENDREVLLFLKYAIYIPFILTLFLEYLQYLKIINIDWLWIFSPIWIWIGGCVQFLLGSILVEAMDKKDNK